MTAIPESRPLLNRVASGTCAGELAGDRSGAGLSSHPRPPPINIPQPVLAMQAVGLSPFNALTPLDDSGALHTHTTKMMAPSPNADMPPLISPFGTVPSAAATAPATAQTSASAPPAVARATAVAAAAAGTKATAAGETQRQQQRQGEGNLALGANAAGAPAPTGDAAEAPSSAPADATTAAPSPAWAVGAGPESAAADTRAAPRGSGGGSNTGASPLPTELPRAPSLKLKHHMSGDSAKSSASGGALGRAHSSGRLAGTTPEVAAAADLSGVAAAGLHGTAALKLVALGGGAVAAPLTGRAKEWSVFGDRLVELDQEDAEDQAHYLADAVIQGPELAMAALQRRRLAAGRGALHPLLSPMLGGAWGAGSAPLGAHAELVTDEAGGAFQVHCFAPGCSTPVMISEYTNGLEACLATEHVNLLIECNPQLLSSAYPMAHPGPASFLSPHAGAAAHGGSRGDGAGGRLDSLHVAAHTHGGSGGDGVITPIKLRHSPAGGQLQPEPGSTGGGKGRRGGRRGRGVAGDELGLTLGSNASLSNGGGAVPQQGGSRYLGVEWDARRQGWAAFVVEGTRRKQVWLTRVYATEEEAARARDREVLRRNKHGGERLNFPDDILGPSQGSFRAASSSASGHVAECHSDSDGLEAADAGDDPEYVPGSARPVGGRGGNGLMAVGGSGGRRGSAGGLSTAAAALLGAGSSGALAGYSGSMGGMTHGRGKRGTPPSGELGDGSAPSGKRQRGGGGYAPSTHKDGSRSGVPTSKYRGVVWDEDREAWRAQLLDGGARRVLGFYESQDEAARAYDMAVVRDNRKDKTNFPPTLYKDGNHLTLTKGTRGSPNVKVTSQYKGVSWNSACSKWVAVLWDRELKRARHIGSFESEEAAARAYDREAIKMLGADAGLNFRESLDEYVRLTGVEIKLADPSSSVPGKGSSQYRGVSWHERSSRWEVRVWGGGKQHFIGSFTDEVDAAKAYDKAVIRLRGQVRQQDVRSRSRMNFPLSDYNLDEVMAEPMLPLGLLQAAGASPSSLAGSAGRGGSGLVGAALDFTGLSAGASGGAHEERPARRSGRQTRRRHDDDMMSDLTATSGEDEDDDALAMDAPGSGARHHAMLRSTPSRPRRAAAARAHSLSPARSDGTAAAHHHLHTVPVLAAKPQAALLPGGALQITYPTAHVVHDLSAAGTTHHMHPALLPATPPLVDTATGVPAGLANQPPGLGADGSGSEGKAAVAAEPAAGGLQSNPHLLALISVLQSAADSNAMQPPLQPTAALNGSAPMDLGGDEGGRRGRGLSRRAAQGVAAVTAAMAAAEGELGPSMSGGGGGGEGRRVSLTSGGSQCGGVLGPVPLMAPAPVPQGTRGKSQYRGVSWCEKVKKWRALLWDGTKQRFLGHYVTDLDAARAYDRALLDLKGPDAKTNFPATMYDNDVLGEEGAARKPASSQYKGVSFNKSVGRWESRLRFNGRTYVVGSYASETEAARAHDCASLHLRGPAANFPVERYPEHEMLDAARRIEHAIAGGGDEADFVDAAAAAVAVEDAAGGDGGAAGGGGRRSGRRRTDMSLSGVAGQGAGVMQVGLCLLGGGGVHPVVQQVQLNALAQGLVHGVDGQEEGSKRSGGKAQGALGAWSSQPRDKSAAVAGTGLDPLGSGTQLPANLVALDEGLAMQPASQQLLLLAEGEAGAGVAAALNRPPVPRLSSSGASASQRTNSPQPCAGTLPAALPLHAPPQLLSALSSGAASLPPHRASNPGSTLSSAGRASPAPPGSLRRGSVDGGPSGTSSLSGGGTPAAGGAGLQPPSLGRGRSQFRGVSWHVVNNRYIARIRTNTGGNTHLGCFDSAHEAAQAYDVAAIALRGPHQAITNFPAAQYLTEQGMLRPELLDLLAKASTPIVPVAMGGQLRRRSASGATAPTTGASAPTPALLLHPRTSSSGAPPPLPRLSSGNGFSGPGSAGAPHAAFAGLASPGRGEGAKGLVHVPAVAVSAQAVSPVAFSPPSSRATACGTPAAARSRPPSPRQQLVPGVVAAAAVAASGGRSTGRPMEDVDRQAAAALMDMVRTEQQVQQALAEGMAALAAAPSGGPFGNLPEMQVDSRTGGGAGPGCAAGF